MINFPPAPLDTLDNYNVALSAASLIILMALFLVAIVASLFLLQWKEWTLHEYCINGLKITLFLAGCAFLARYVIEMVIGAVEFTFRDERSVPSNEILFIELCDGQTLETRYELCDERIFVVKVVIAWFTAAIFVAYLFFKPATYAVEESFYTRHKSRVHTFLTSVRTSTLRQSEEAAAAADEADHHRSGLANHTPTSSQLGSTRRDDPKRITFQEKFEDEENQGETPTKQDTTRTSSQSEVRQVSVSMGHAAEDTNENIKSEKKAKKKKKKKGSSQKTRTSSTPKERVGEEEQDERRKKKTNMSLQ